MSAGWLMMSALLIAVPMLALEATSFKADRAAIERVYHNHRLGEKPSFEETMPPALLDKLVRLDLHKEAVLKRAYAVELTAAQIAAEVQRINTTTRAPETLAELKAALGNDPDRFARAMAKPLLVERILRERFENDDTLHAPQRHQVEQTRRELLAAKTNGADHEKLRALFEQRHPNAVTETTWQMVARPAEVTAPSTDEIEIKQRFGPNAQLLSSPQTGGKDQKNYFEELPVDFQRVLRVQLRQAGDVSAVIETPGGFLLYVAKERTDEVLSVTGLSLPKRSYEEWLETQSSATP